MTFDKSRIKPTYNSEDDSILNDFYIPCLKEAITYDRAVGFFSASMLTYAAQGLSSFVSNYGEMRLIIGHQVENDEFEAIQNGEQLKKTYERLNIEFEKIIHNVSSEIFTCRLEFLSWLVSTNRLKIKFAIRRHGMYHEKIGILKDKEGNRVVFQGSANESQMALLPDFNFESISVYPSWESDIYEKYGSSYESRFEQLWNNNTKQTVVVDVPSDIYNQLSEVYKSIKAPPEYIEKILFDQLLLNPKPISLLPELPKLLGSSEYQLKEHQKKALNNWKSNSFNGIFALATGAGKTITALHAATQLANFQNNLVLIVAVPYQNLADQWCEVMELFSMNAIRCYMSKAQWKTELSTAISDFNLNQSKPFVAIVVVNKTLSSDTFQNEIKRIKPDKLLFVGDECHRHANEKIIKKLPESKFRIGLSATPWSRYEEKKEEILKSFYGGIISEYSIENALNDGVLTPYIYKVHFFYLTSEETDNYQRITHEISKLLLIKDQGGAIDENKLITLCMQRARLLGSAENKFELLDEYLNNNQIDKHTLFYCGDGSVVEEKILHEEETSGRDIDRVVSILNSYGWKASRFTADETLQERRRIIDNFKNGFIDAMVSIRVLDEGIDIPVCKQAFLLASSRNERQFIQRRGRILRKSPGKEYSIIHDFIALPCITPDRNDHLDKLVNSELDRLIEFAYVAKNRNEIYEIGKAIAKEYGIDWLSKILEKTNN